MKFYIRSLILTSFLSLFAFSPALAQTIPSTLGIGEVFSTTVPGRADLTLDFTDRDYELILYALKTTSDTTKTFSFRVSPPAAAKVAFTRALKGMAPDGRDRAEAELRAEERRLAGILRRNPRVPSKPVVTQAPAVGSSRTFAFRKFGGVKQDVTVTARLVAISPKALAYVDVSQAGMERKPVTTAQIQAMLDEFSGTTHPLVTPVFGGESDVDADGRVLFLYTPLVNQVGGIAGFYSAASALPASRGGNGNLCDMMYLSPDQAPGFYRSLLAHEFQHLINFNQHVLARTGGESEDSWLNEGLSHITEDLVGDHTLGGNNGLVETFLAHPERYSLTGDALLNLGVRGAAYLFVRGLADQKGQGVLSSLTQTGKAGAANVEGVVGQPFADLYRQWAARLFLSGTQLNAAPVYNYTFPFLTEATTGRRAVPPPREDALTAGGTPLSGTLRPTGLTFVRLTGSGPSVKVQVTADAEGDVRALVIPAPKAFRPQLVAPVDFFEYLKLDAPLSSSQTAGAGFTISGQVNDPTVSKVMLRFARTDGPADSLKFIANVVNGRFSRPVVFAQSQAGTYVLAPFLLREGPLFDGTNAFGPVVVARGDGVTLPADFFTGLRFDQPVPAVRTSGEGFSLAGAATDPAIREVLFRFVRQDRPDSVRFFAEVTGGRFRRPVVFTPSQAGTYKFEVFARRGGPLYDYVDEFPEFVVKKGLTDDVTLPPDYFKGITFDALFPATITAGVGLRLSGSVADQTANRMLVNFAPAQGDDIQFGLDVQGGRFSQDVVFTPEQAGTYKLSFYLGQRGTSSFPYVDGFEPVTVKVVPGIKVMIPTGYFSGLTLDAAFPADVFVGKAVRFSGMVTNSANTQIAVRFDALDGGQNIPASFINVSNGRFSQDLTLTQTGRYGMVVFLGGPGQSLPFAGQFDGIRARASQADVAVTVPRLDFGEVPAGGSKEQVLTLYNRGTLALTLRDVTASSALLSATPRAATVAAGDSLRVTVTFRPVTSGDLAGTLTVLSDDPDEGSLTVSVVGRGLAQTVLRPTLTLSATSLAFDSVRIGNVRRQTLTVSNSGNDSLRVTRLAISGADSAHFSASPGVFTVGPGKGQDVTVTFAPGSADKKAATLTATHNATGSPTSLPLTGTGVAAAPPSRVGDFNGDALVNFDDFFLFANVFGTERGKPGYDVNYDLDSDGAVGFNDFFIFADRFGK
ncbi:MAG: choice-of-anchor D domain-containing protein [Candidatus Latescibacteria bacterium]|nr:choice-of-anchor D domain-containing protein [Candidatus Latescibacterota bacterium]